MSQVTERFLNYVSFDTQSKEDAGKMPSTEKQWELAKCLKQELEEMGAERVRLSEYGYIYAEIPANVPANQAEKIPSLGFIAHMDTAPALTGANVKPQFVKNYDGKDIRNGLVAIVSIKHPDPQFESQTKNKLGNTDAKTAVDEVFSQEVQRYFDKNVEVLKSILDNVRKSYKARTASDKARRSVLKELMNVDTKSKLAACTSKKAEECEIYIVEGDSAGGTVKTARNRRTQAVLPLRGKILNVEKAPLEKILLNNEIKSMIASFGCGIGDDFDIKKLRYDKIIILTDADVDGAHISTLLLTFFYRFMPELIYQGKVYRGLPPLYKVDYEDTEKRKKVKKSEYLFNDFELEKFRKTGKKINALQRYKGLGEMDDKQLWETTLDPDSRILAQISISDTVEADEVTDILMGSNVPPRRQFIMEEAKSANVDI